MIDIKDVNKAFREHMQAKTHNGLGDLAPRKVRIIFFDNARVMCVVEFIDEDARLKNGNLRGHIISNLQESAEMSNSFTLEMVIE